MGGLATFGGGPESASASGPCRDHALQKTGPVRGGVGAGRPVLRAAACLEGVGGSAAGPPRGGPGGPGGGGARRGAPFGLLWAARPREKRPWGTRGPSTRGGGGPEHAVAAPGREERGREPVRGGLVRRRRGFFRPLGPPLESLTAARAGAGAVQARAGWTWGPGGFTPGVRGGDGPAPSSQGWDPVPLPSRWKEHPRAPSRPPCAAARGEGEAGGLGPCAVFLRARKRRGPACHRSSVAKPAGCDTARDAPRPPRPA